MRGWGRGGDGPQRALGAGAWGALGLVRGAPWPPPAVRCTLSLSSLICRRGAVRVSGWRSSARGGQACPRACLQGLRVWAPAAGGGPSPRRPRVLLWTWGDGSTSRPHQGTGAPPGAGGRAVTVGGRGTHPPPCRAGIWGGRASGGGGTTSPLSPQCPLLCSGGQPAPPSREALVASRCGCPTVTECWRPGPGRLPRRLQCGGARFSRRGRTGVRSPDMVALGPGGLQGRPRGPWLAHRQRSVTCPDQGRRGQVSWGRGTSKVLAAGQWASSPGPWALLSRPS